VEARWTGGLAVLAPLASLEPGQPDRGVRVLDFEATTVGWKLRLEGPAGGSASVGLYGETPASAEGATLRAGGPGAQVTVSFPVSTDGLFSSAEVLLRRVRTAGATP
jgi:hypothetical protein